MLRREETSHPFQERGQRGFTMVELLVATAVLLFGVVAVADLVPRAMQSNLNNRYDSTAAVVVQRLRDLMVRQAFTEASLTDPNGQFPCGAGACRLGVGAANSDVFEGSPVRRVRDGLGREVDLIIDFTSARVNGFNFVYTDANDPAGTRFDVRWAVITSRRPVGDLPDVTVGKRIVIGARSMGTTQPVVVSFTTWITR